MKQLAEFEGCSCNAIDSRVRVYGNANSLCMICTGDATQRLLLTRAGSDSDIFALNTQEI